MALKVKITNINILLQDLDRYSQKAQSGIVNEIKNWADRTEADAQRDVPVDTGALKSSIRTSQSNNGLTWSVLAGGINNVNYAPFIEFGTGARVDKSFLQQYGLTQYASQFRGKQSPIFALPSRSYLYKNARLEFEKTLQNIQKLLQQT